MKPTILLLLACVLAVSISAQRVDSLDRTAESSIKVGRDKDGNRVLTTINRRFTLTESVRPLLLLEEFRHDLEAGHEQAKGVVKVDAWRQPDLNKKAWSIEQSGDEGRVADEFYVVTKYGCCMSPTTSVYFNIDNGERIVSATDKLSSVIIPNTDQYRYVAWHSAYASIPPTETHETDLQGVLQYVSYKAPLWKLAIYSKRDVNVRIKLRYEGKLVESESLMLWGVDGKRDKSSLSNFEIVLSMDSAGEIVLPITNDEVDLTRATIPPLFRVEVVK
ncbi:MAG TPA: hypothetical protein VFH96_03415 [Pyrinomonadaceae bacterium]|nr:hypothetical protein [Pyrinomonadaceae bacterium]